MRWEKKEEGEGKLDLHSTEIAREEGRALDLQRPPTRDQQIEDIMATKSSEMKET